MKANKNWVFSGIGVLPLSVLLSIWLQHDGRGSRGGASGVQEGAAATDPVPPKPTRRITDISIDNIYVNLEKVPPLQQEEAASHYVGLWVDWRGSLDSVRREPIGKVDLTLALPSKSHRGIRPGERPVSCTVNLADYKELAIAPKGTPIRVVGEISKVEMDWLTLSNAELTFEKPNPQ